MRVHLHMVLKQAKLIYSEQIRTEVSLDDTG
jgi:hypothetical protein